ncbi:molybdopterin-dependent oxidoreductase [Campylobacter ureolyticus]|uniref:Molybdopterin-containing oxidoreductase III, DMSO/TMAO/BSO reductase family, catalytic subunit n=1 Tax=Campylobacter ureolyticus TaxID=827 RepID=A0AAE7JQ72_9BACT|nr:molybdopterin-dependent oxidoreductase [Campylobacter ureolyticus]MCR8685283.1 molybdopterin-dependent oxidoreductase [Campylobacter ureolyticus]QKF85163.1 molybdopterin-containing oxidoreductase III, DMSO/TMAO/BSO reductase family, catalytic subunit [Campylobacter ureolyticus]QQY36358.1 molybdopterin-dependent oxidoreductase [Campylobacter ureolyticus]SUX25453.1 trimethylamine-n-oxide reductase 1 [Campylobacter ureolyticus]
MKRRDFMKFSLVASSAAYANRIEAIKETIFDDKKVLSANRFGAFYAKLNSGQIVSVDNFEHDAFPTTMNNSLADRIQNESRVLYPYVRKSYLEKRGPNKPELRGEDEFVRVSWDEALDLAANALKENFDKYGPESIYGECYWWGGCGKVSWGRTVAHRMLTILGGYVEETDDYSTGAGIAIMPYVLGSTAVYDTPTRWEAIIKECKNVVFWGTNPVVTNQIGGAVNTHNVYKYYQKVKKLKDEGKISITSIDTFRNDTARYFESEYIPVRPNTDTAMMIGMCHYLYENKLYDEEFIKKYTVGFNKFKDYFLGKNDGVVKDLAWASKICNVEVKALEELCKKLAKDNSIIIAGRALQRQDHGEQVFWMVVTLSAMLGHIGKMGGGFEFNQSYNNGGAGSMIGPSLKGISAIPSQKYTDENSPWTKNKNYTIPTSRSIQALESPGSEIGFKGTKIKLPRMRVAYNASGSMFTRHQDVNRAVEAWKKLDTVITAEPFWTSQAKLSDIVLPVAIEGERTDIIESQATREFIFALKPVITPMGESKSDFQICKEICKRWGMEEVFSEGKSELEWVKEIYADVMNQAKTLGYTNMPSFDEFWEKGYVRFDKKDDENKYYTRLSNFRENPRKFRLGTPSGKIEIFSPEIEKMGYDDCLAHPVWLEPFEWLGNKEKTKKYPLAISSPHSRFRLHSQLNNSIIRNYTEIGAREPVILSPKAAKARDIKTGDIVRIFNDRGEILCGAIVSDIAQDDVAIICEGAWYDPEVYGKKTLCQHGCVNVLTHDKGTSKLGQSNCAHTCLAEIERYKGVVMPIRAFSKPKIKNA